MSIPVDYDIIREGARRMLEIPHGELALYLAASYFWLEMFGMLDGFVPWAKDAEIGVAMIDEVE